MTDLRKFNICVRLSDDESDGEGEVYKATVREFPDLAIFEGSASAAYDEMLEVLTDMCIRYASKGKPFPAPTEANHFEASGRTTVRMSKGLHVRLAQAAIEEEISLNQFIVESCAWRLDGAKRSAVVHAPNAISINCEVGSGSVIVNTQRDAARIIRSSSISSSAPAEKEEING